MIAQIRTIFNYPKLYWKKQQFVKNSEMGGNPYWKMCQLHKSIGK